MTTFRAWLAATRPKTLVAAVAPIALGGTVVVAYSGALGLWTDRVFVLTLLSCLGFALCVQVACNFANDLGDSLRGADTSARIGPRRAVSSGDISPAAMQRGIWIACILALMLGAPVALLSPWLLLAGLLAIACALAYTLGPFPLAYRGLGDVFVVACFGVQATTLTVWAISVALTNAVMPWVPALLAGLGLGLLADNILVANNARDYETDLAVGKRTTVVRFGRGFARNLHGFNSVFGLACLGHVFGWAPMALLPLAIWQHLAFRKAAQPADFLPFLGRAAVLMLLATILCVTATCLGWVPADSLWMR
jgi:1,4-dihydroxy-2-naphthoate octaprenyltransferase